MPRKAPKKLFLNADLHYQGTEIDAVVDVLFEEIKKKKQRIREAEEYKRHISILVLNLFEAYRISESSMSIGISRNANYYSGKSIGYKYMVTGTLDNLVDSGYVNLVSKGVYIPKEDKKKNSRKRKDNPNVEATVSTYRASKKLIKLFKSLNLYKVKQDFDKFFSVRVGNKETKLVDPLENDFYFEQKETLKSINEYYDSIHIDLCVTNDELTKIRQQMSNKKARAEWLISEDDVLLRDINFRDKYIYRKFWNNDYNLHGRYYGGFWQGIPSEWRQRLTINNQRTTELDYTNMHFAMLYHEKGLMMNLSEDLYDFSSKVPSWKKGEYRDECKLVMNYMLNCDDKEQVLKVINNNKKEMPKVPKGFTWEGLIDFLIEQNQPIEDAFFSNQGIRLMFHDSRIVEQILKWGVKEDICVLSIHDSFCVKKQHEYKLLFKMHEVYEEIVGKVGKPVKQDYLGLKHLYDLEGDTSGYKDRLQEWNWHRQSYGDSSLPLTLPDGLDPI
mgnify:CR=1 FL=1